MVLIDFNNIQRFATDIGCEFLPDRVILFGSCARGNTMPKSDVDLLVIMPGDVSGIRVAAEYRYPGESADKAIAKCAVKMAEDVKRAILRTLQRYSDG